MGPLAALQAKYGSMREVPGFSGLTVKEPTGKRWELALVLLRSGEAAVSIDGVILHRDVHGPRSTGRIKIDIPASSTPPFLSSTVAERDVARALGVIEAASNADARFARILADLGTDHAYVDGYSTGSVVLAEVTADGQLIWYPEWKPQDATK